MLEPPIPCRCISARAEAPARISDGKSAPSSTPAANTSNTGKDGGRPSEPRNRALEEADIARSPLDVASE